MFLSLANLVRYRGLIWSLVARDLKARYPKFNLHAFSAPEIWHFHKLNKLPQSSDPRLRARRSSVHPTRRQRLRGKGWTSGFGAS